MCCNDSPSAGLLTRKKEQTAIEGMCPRHMWHRSKNAKAECIRGGFALMHSSFLFLVHGHLRAAAVPSVVFLLADRRAHAWYIQFMAWWHCYCAFPLPLVVHLRFLPGRPSNELSCLILIMCRHCARLSLIVPFRMLFMDRYFTVHRAVEALLNASTWPGYSLQVGRAEDAQKTQQKRRMTEL